MSTNHPWTEKLSEYVDETLEPREREALEAHMATCTSCTETLAELRRVVAHAAVLESRGPEQDLWAGIAERIGAEVTHEPEPVPSRWEEVRGREAVGEAARPWWRLPELTFTFPQLAAACLVIAMLASGVMWVAIKGLPGGAPPGEAPFQEPIADATDASDGTTPDTPDPGAFEMAGYERTISDLEQALETQRDELDPSTVRVLRDNLAIIDAAIADSRRAIAADPASPFLYRHLNRQMQRKVDVLRQATYALAGN